MATPTIPLGIRPPQFESGADTLQRGLGMANLATANQINQVRLQEEKQKAQELAEDREDQNAIQREFLNPAHLKPDKDDPTHRVMDFDSLRGALAGKVRMRSLQQLDKDHLAQVQAIRQTSAAEKADQYNALALKREQNLAVGREIQGLEQLDDKDKPAFYAGALQRLKKQNIDVSDMPETIPGDGSFNQRLQALAAVHGYSGALLNDAMRKQKLDTAAAQEKRAIAESESKDSEVQQKKKAAQREEIARMYLAADPQTPEEHLALVDKIDSNYPAVATEYAGIKFDPDKTPRIMQDMALPAEKRMVAGQRDEAAQARADYQQDSLDLRRQIARQTDAFRQDSLDLRRDLGAGRSRNGLTQNAFKVEERNISSLEDGTANRPGLNAQRRKLGTMLASGVNEKGEKVEFSTEEGKIVKDRITSAIQAVNDNLQQVQFRKAKLYGIDYPATEDIEAAKDGEPIEALDGSVWKKSYGVAFYQGKGKGTDPGTPKPSASAAPKPATPAKAAPPAPPDAVVKRLSTGEHTFKNGQVWIKKADGTMQYVRG